MRDHINIRRARNGFIVSYEPDYSLNAIGPMGPNETICEDSDAVLKALGEMFEEMKTKANTPAQTTGWPEYAGAGSANFARAHDQLADVRAREVVNGAGQHDGSAD